MARFSGGSGGGSGTPGPRGPRGFDGEDGVDALWNYTGEYSGGAAYAVGDVATYDGQLWYRANANGGNVGDTPSEGFIWNLLAAKGEDGTDASGGLVFLGDYVLGNGYVENIAIVRGSDDNLYIAKDSGGLQDPVGNAAQWDIFSYTSGSGGTADIADFTFTFTPEDVEEEISAKSIINIHNHDMRIETTRDGSQDSDISITSADDVWITANDGIEITSTNSEVAIYAGAASNQWGFQSDAGLRFPDQTVQTTAYTGGAGADTGDITFVESTISNDTGDDIVIQNKNDDGIVKASIRLDQSNEQVLIEAIASDSEWFSDTQWSTAVWAGSVVTITNTPDIINFFNNVSGDVTRVSINDGGLITYEGASFGSGNMTLNVGGTPVAEEDPLTVTEIRFYYSLVSKINIDHDDSTFEIVSNGMSMTIDSSGDLELKARDEDLSLYANDDVRFTTNWDNNGTEHSWRMSEIGQFELPGAGYIENPINSSGDNGSSDTIKIVPDADLLEASIYNVDQYVIIDPTGPNHIHIRAGGAQDYSTADLILGGERAGVKVSDTDGTTTVRSKKEDYVWTYVNANDTEGTVYIISSEVAEPDINDFMIMNGTKFVITSVTRNEQAGFTSYETTPSFEFVPGDNYTFTRNNGNYAWEFVAVDDRPALVLPPEEPIIVNSAVPGDITLSAYNGVKLSFADTEGAGLEFPDETVQTTAYIPGVDVSAETSFTVNGGTLGDQPTFTGDPLFTGSYVKTGPMVHFQIQVDMNNILTFGTGQYFVELPFHAKYGYQFKNGCLHDISTGNQFAIGGHVVAGSNQLLLNYIGSNGQDEVFDFNSPITLNVADNFHISGDYIISDVD